MNNSITSVSGGRTSRQDVTLADLIKEAQEKKKQAAVGVTSEAVHKPVERVDSLKQRENNLRQRRLSANSDVISYLSSISELERSTNMKKKTCHATKKIILILI